MISLFAILPLLAIPQMLVYQYFDGYNSDNNVSAYAKLSFGDMGYSGNYCGQNFINWKEETTNINL